MSLFHSKKYAYLLFEKENCKCPVCEQQKWLLNQWKQVTKELHRIIILRIPFWSMPILWKVIYMFFITWKYRNHENIVVSHQLSNSWIHFAGLQCKALRLWPCKRGAYRWPNSRFHSGRWYIWICGSRVYNDWWASQTTIPTLCKRECR